jgi:hypothetical protein
MPHSQENRSLPDMADRRYYSNVLTFSSDHPVAAATAPDSIPGRRA